MKGTTILDKKWLRFSAAAIFWVGLWQLVSMLVGKELLLPSPYATAKALANLVQMKLFWVSVLASLLRVFSGFICGCILGAVIGAVSYLSKPASIIFLPAVRLMRTVPVASFIILALIWLKAGLLPGVISAVVVIPVVCENVLQGIESTDKNLLEVGICYSFGRRKKLKLIYIPSVKPYFKAACSVATGMAWKAGVAAEVLCQPKSAIGTQLYYSKIYLETDKLFAWTAAVVILSFILERLFLRLMKDKKR